MIIGNGISSFAVGALKWLDPLAHVVGLGVAVWAFVRSRKPGYLVVASYFAFVLLWPVVWPPIRRAIYAGSPPVNAVQAHHKPDVPVVEPTSEKPLDGESQTESVVPIHNSIVRLPVGPALLVVGLWLLARRESMNGHQNISRRPTDRKRGSTPGS